MGLALLAARLLLASVFGVAGLAKLADRAGSRKALVGFGIPAATARVFGVLLPLVELLIAFTLLPVATTWWGAVGTLALLLLFVAGIGLNLARGRRPDCHCFGQLHSEPVGPGTLARNGVLAVVAAFVVWQGRDDPGPSLVSWLTGLITVEPMGLVVGVASLALTVALTWLVLELSRQQGRLLLRIDALEAQLSGAPVPPPNGAAAAPQGLPVGSPAPAFDLVDLDGQHITLHALRRAGKPLLLLFTDPNCGPCNVLLPEIGRWQREHAQQLTMATISRGTARENRGKAAEHGLELVLLQNDYEVGTAYHAYGTPSAVLVRPDGTIGSPVAAGAEAIRSLVRHVVGSGAGPWAGFVPLPMVNGHLHGHDHGPAMAPPSTVKRGEPAPSLRLPDLNGKTVDLADFRGHKTLVLFWNPGCGYCQQMLADLKSWEESPPWDSPKVLVVSTGTAEANRAQGIRSPVVLDQDFSMGRAFGANGTPTAVLVDTEGRVASDIAAGAQAVWALAGTSPSQDKMAAR